MYEEIIKNNHNGIWQSQKAFDFAVGFQIMYYLIHAFFVCGLNQYAVITKIKESVNKSN